MPLTYICRAMLAFMFADAYARDSGAARCYALRCCRPRRACFEHVRRLFLLFFFFRPTPALFADA